MNPMTAIDRVIDIEGGYVNDPADPGGETKYGISKRSYPCIDIRSLTLDQARAIYLNDHWRPSRTDQLPERLQMIYFDMVVNMGRRRAVRILQEAINQGRPTGGALPVIVDGIIGIETLTAAAQLDADRLRSFRVLYYARLVSQRSTLMRYWYGWYLRATRI